MALDKIALATDGFASGASFPEVDEVETGIQYGPNGTDFTGTAAPGGATPADVTIEDVGMQVE